MKNHWHRKARQLLMDHRGRAALKEFGIDVEIAEKEEAKDKPIVAILCPTYRAPEPEMKDGLLHMCQRTNESQKATVYVGPPCSASVVHWSRNWLIGEQLKSGKPWSHVLFIDDDIVVEPDALLKLLSHKKDIIAGVCTRRNDPPVPNIRWYDKQDGNTRPMLDFPANSLIEVDAVGTGLMLISKHALEQVAQMYFDCLWEKDFYGMTEDRIERIRKERLAKFDAEKICYWFRFLPTERGDIEMGEDVTFCYLAKKYCGLNIYVDTSVQPGHLGPYGFGVKDFLPYRELYIERAKQEGTYRAQPHVEAEISLVG